MGRGWVDDDGGVVGGGGGEGRRMLRRGKSWLGLGSMWMGRVMRRLFFCGKS